MRGWTIWSVRTLEVYTLLVADLWNEFIVRPGEVAWLLGTALEKLLGSPPRLTMFPCVVVPNMIPHDFRFLDFGHRSVFSKAPSHSHTFC